MSTQVLGSDSFTVTPDVNGLFVLLNGGGTGTLTTGTFASRPAAGTVGNLYVDSTNSVMYYDSGSAWSTLGVGPNPIFAGTSSLTAPIGSTAQRPGTPTTGMLRYNSTTGYFEFYDTAWISISGVIDKSTTTVTTTTTGSNVSLLSYSVPANTLGTAGVLRVRMGGTWLSGGAGRTVNFIISYGGTNLWNATSGAQAAGTVSWMIEFDLLANNSTTAQALVGRVTISPGATTNVSSGIGTLASVTTTPWAATTISGTSAIASTSAQTLSVTVNQSASGTFTKYYHTTELL